MNSPLVRTYSTAARRNLGGTPTHTPASDFRAAAETLAATRQIVRRVGYDSIMRLMDVGG